MKRVLLITNIFPPHIGGPATFIDKLAHKLSRDDYRVTVVCSSDEKKEVSDNERPFKVIRVCIKNREWYEIKVRFVLLWQMFWHRRVLVNGLETYVSQVSRFVRRRYLLKVVGDVVWETARNRGTTVNDIDVFQTDMVDQKNHKALVDARNRFVFRASRIITPSSYLKRMVEGWGVPGEKICVVNNGVASPGKKVSQPDRSEIFTVLFVGRLTNWKGVETVLLALRELDGILLKVAGDGPEYPMLRALAMQLGVEHQVMFLGKKTHAEVSVLMSQVDVLVLLSLYEGMSHTLLEAISVGLPVVASNRGGNPEVIEDGVSGILIDPLSVSQLCTALSKLKSDFQFRSLISTNALQRSEGFRLDATVDSVCKILEG